MKLRRLATLVLTLVLLVNPAAASVRGSPSETHKPPAAATTPGKSPVAGRAQPGSRRGEKRYKAREAASKNAKNFRGGEPVVVITATAAIIILLGVIIILLIT
jgi:hypothetical protein